MGVSRHDTGKNLHGFFFYIFFALVWILGIWVYYEYKWKAKKYIPPEKKMYRCLICAHIYLEDRDKKVTRCPRCRSLNESPVKPE